MKEKGLKKQKKQKQQCSICYTRKITAQIDCCPHEFCYTCIKNWLKNQNPTCPLCRSDVGEIRSIRTKRLLYRVVKQKIVEEQFEAQWQEEEIQEIRMREPSPARYTQQRRFQSGLRGNVNRNNENKQQGSCCWCICCCLLVGFIFS